MKIKQYITIALLSVVFFGCDMIGSIDDIELDNVLEDDELVTDSRSAETALNGVYASWNHIDIGWFINHLSFRSRTIKPMGVVGAGGFSTNDVKIENSMIGRNYTALYRIINMANSVLAQLEKDAPKDIEETRLKGMLAEIRYSRALAHFMLLRQYGEFYNLSSDFGIVTYEKPTRDNIPKERNNVKESFDLIEKDLRFAGENASAEQREHYYVGRAASKALLSRVLLYQQKFDEAATLAGEVIDNAAAEGYALESDYLDIFRKRSLSQEVLFAPYAQYPGENNFMLINSIFIATSAQNIADELVEGNFNINSGEGMDHRIAKAFGRPSIGAEGNFSTGTNKYFSPIFEKGAMANTLFFMRLAEVYLIKAEADARMERFDDARNSLDIITTRAGYEADYADEIADEDLLMMIFKHKWMELAFENNEEWFDIVRFHTLDGMDIKSIYVVDDKHLTLPIPRVARAGNNLLLQNPSYDDSSK